MIYLILSGTGAIAVGYLGPPKMPWPLKAELSVNFTQGDWLDCALSQYRFIANNPPGLGRGSKY